MLKTMWKFLTSMVLLLSACTPAGELSLGPIPESFQKFYTNLQIDAEAQGLNTSLLNASFGHQKPHPIYPILQSEKAQPEFKRTFSQYTTSMVTPTRIKEGQKWLEEYTPTLQTQTARTGVPAGVLVAMWGVETAYGKNMGATPVIPALVTLAWKSPRPLFYRKEVFAALQVAQEEKMNPSKWVGSWAGASGGCQFMPSNVLKYATDGNADGIADIWNTPEDVLASTATFLQKSGWKAEQPWKITAPENVSLKGIKLNSRGLSDPQPLTFWHKRGFPKSSTVAFAKTDKLRAFQPEKEGPIYLLGPNFDVILSWNMSSYFAFSALSLADSLQQPRTQL